MEVLIFLTTVVSVAIIAAIAVVSGVFTSLLGVIAEEEDAEE